MGRVDRLRQTHPRLYATGIGLAVWAGLLLIFILVLRLAGTMTWSQATLVTLREWLPWMLVSPLVLFLARRFPIDGTSWTWSLPLHVVGSLGAVLLTELVLVGVISPLFPALGRPMDAAPPTRPEYQFAPGQPQQPPPVPHSRPLRFAPGSAPPGPELPPNLPFPELIVRRLSVGLPVYWVMVMIQSLLLYYRRYRESQLEALAMEKDLARAQLESLKAQLQPHFLFNTLNAISTLVHTDPDKADEMIGQLSYLLRSFLERRDGDEVPVRVECRLLEAYVRIEQARFGDRLTYTQSVHPDAQDGLVPILLLQPLVENAVRHGIEPLQGAGQVSLAVRREDDDLRIVLSDNGVGRGGGSTQRGHGVGLSNARARLAALHGAEGYSLHVTDLPAGGTVIDIRLPYKPDPLPASVPA